MHQHVNDVPGLWTPTKTKGKPKDKIKRGKCQTTNCTDPNMDVKRQKRKCNITAEKASCEGFVECKRRIETNKLQRCKYSLRQAQIRNEVQNCNATSMNLRVAQCQSQWQNCNATSIGLTQYLKVAQCQVWSHNSEAANSPQGMRRQKRCMIFYGQKRSRPHCG